MHGVLLNYATDCAGKGAHSLEDPTVPDETIKRRARSVTENIANSMHDDYIKENAGTRTQAGLKCYLVRDAGGGCCKWCQALAGRYDYATAPDDIFRRHDNCTCTVTYECGRQRQDVCSTIFFGQSPSWERMIPVRLRQSQPSLPICTRRTMRFLEMDVSRSSNSI